MGSDYARRYAGLGPGAKPLLDPNVSEIKAALGHERAADSTEPSVHDFMMVVRDALLMIVRHIEREYGKR